MRILLTEDCSRLGSELIGTLATAHQVQTLPLGCDPFDGQTLWAAVRGVDAVVHTGEPLTDAAKAPDGDRALLDEATRGVCVLLEAATDAGVRRVVHCSSLELFARKPADRYISEQWRPDPGTDTPVLARHLAEQVTREFARDKAVSITVLRLGRLHREEEVPTDAAPDPMWCDLRDAAAAVAKAVHLDRSDQLNWQSRWQVLHVCAAPPNPQFLLDGARRLDWEPQHNFERQWAAAAP